MAKLMLNVKAEDIISIKDGDILVYDEEKKYFYKQTAQNFWKKHNEELKNIIKRYDEVVARLEEKERQFEEKISQIVHKLENSNKKTNEKLNTSLEEYLVKNQNVTAKLINMVENFVKTGGNA